MTLKTPKLSICSSRHPHRLLCSTILLSIRRRRRPRRSEASLPHVDLSDSKPSVDGSASAVRTIDSDPVQANAPPETLQRWRGGRGLHSTLNFHSKKFIGILNGIDADAWNPATDEYLKVQYSANDIEGKAENKKAMRRSLGLSSDVRRPLIGAPERCASYQTCNILNIGARRAVCTSGFKPGASYSGTPCITDCMMAQLEKLGQKYRVAIRDPLCKKSSKSTNNTIYMLRFPWHIFHSMQELVLIKEKKRW